MITVNGMSVIKFLDKEKTKELQLDYQHTLMRSSIDNRTRRDSTSAKQRIFSRSLHDPKAKSGKGKLFTYGEVIIMEKIQALEKNENIVYEIIKDSKKPISIKSIMYYFNKAYPDVYSKKSRQSFTTIVNNLVKLGLLEKLCIIKGEILHHLKASRLYLRALAPHEVKSASALTLPAEVADEAESQPIPNMLKTTLTEVHVSINEWMDKNDITEFSITIKKRG